MGGSMKGSTTQTSNQSSEPPAWAKPLLTKVAGEAMNMYNSGEGYNTYRGPTQAQWAPKKLEGLNKALVMSGTKGDLTNESIFNTPDIQKVRDMIAAQQLAEQQKKEAAAAAAAAAAAQKKPVRYAANPADQRQYGSAHGGYGYSSGAGSGVSGFGGTGGGNTRRG